MGAVTVYHSFKVGSVEQLKKDFNLLQKESNINHGTDYYSGHIGLAYGLTVKSLVFKTAIEAQDYLDNRLIKGDAAQAVQVGDFKKSFYNKPAILKLIQSIDTLTKEVEEFGVNVVKKAKLAKSKFRACKHCESKINVSKLPTASLDHQRNSLTDCPVCFQNLLITETDANRLKALRKKLTDANTKLNTLQKNVDLTKEPYWYVGACVPI